MDHDRYTVNPYTENVNSPADLLESDQLSPSLRRDLTEQITLLFRQWEDKYSSSADSRDTSVYTGDGGAALLYLKVYQANLSGQLCSRALLQSEDLIGRCLAGLKKHRYTFLCGSAGPLAIQAIIRSLRGADCASYLVEIAKIVKDVLAENAEVPDEILYGRAGVLYALLLLRREIAFSKGVINDALIRQLVQSILNSGQATAKREKSTTPPLVYYWHEKAYIGAAHGYAGILYMLLEARRYLSDAELNSLVRPTIDFVLGLQFSESGNFPSSLSNSSDKLVHWCHGAPGVIHLLALAYQVFNDDKYLNAATKAADDIWTRGLLKKGFGLCHGVAGNGYAFLRMFQLTNDTKYLQRAINFSLWCSSTVGQSSVTRIADRPLSLFEGLAGTIYFFIDLLSPRNAKFPGFQL